MSTRTIYLGRLMGLFLVISSVAAILQKQIMVETADAIIHGRPLVLLLGMILLACGLAIVLAHNVWSGGLLPIVVTLFGWITLARGVLILFLPPESLIDLFGFFRVGELFYLYAGINLVIGLFLTIASFSTSRPPFVAGRPAESF